MNERENNAPSRRHRIDLRLDEIERQAVEAVERELGVDTSAAIRIMLRQHRAPTPTTQGWMLIAESPEGVQAYLCYRSREAAEAARGPFAEECDALNALADLRPIEWEDAP